MGTLLGACRKHGSNVQLVELIAQRFFQLQSGKLGSTKIHYRNQPFFGAFNYFWRLGQ
jgi:hypothetical protein